MQQLCCMCCLANYVVHNVHSMSNFLCSCVAEGQKRGRYRGWRSLPWASYMVPFICDCFTVHPLSYYSFYVISINSCSHLWIEDYKEQNGSADVPFKIFYLLSKVRLHSMFYVNYIGEDFWAHHLHNDHYWQCYQYSAIRGCTLCMCHGP